MAAPDPYPSGTLELARRVTADPKAGREPAEELCRRLEPPWSFPDMIETFFMGDLHKVFDVLADAWSTVEAERAMDSLEERVTA